MASDLKRVGLVFQADGTVDFKKSIKEVNASIQENRSAFKLAQSQWNENTKSIDKLKDRQKYLADQTKDYSDKVKLLEEELSKLEDAEKRDEAAIHKKKQQLDTAKTSLNYYKSALEEVSGKLASGTAELEEYAKKVESIGKKSTELGKTLSKNVTAPIAAVGALAIKSAMELDEGYDTIITKTGATGESLQALNDVADEIFSNMPVEMADVGTAVGEVNTRFQVTGDELKTLSERFLEFANINGVDLNNSIGEVHKIMQQFDVDISDTENLLGILTARSQETGISTDQLMSSVSANSSTFKELGFSVTDSINLLAQFERNGVDASTATAGLRKAVLNMAKDGLTADEALGKIIDSIKNAATETEAMNMASEVFGTKGAVEMTNAIRSGRLSLDDLSDSLGNYAGAVNDTYQSTLDPWDDMKVATNDLKEAGTELAASIFEVLAPIIQSLVDIIKESTDKFSEMDEGQKETIVTIGLLVAAIGPLLAIFGSVAGGVSNIINLSTKIIGLGGKIPGMITKVSTGAKGLWAILSANPVGAVIAIVTSLIAIFVTLYNKCDWFRDGVNKIWGNIKTFLNGIKNWLVNLFKFEWKLPKIKLPHFSISGKFSLNPPSIPKFSVKWYAKGGILNSPTIFGANGNSLMGGGEAGQEAVLPIELLKKYIRDENEYNNLRLVTLIKEAISELQIITENNIYIGDRQIMSQIAELVIKKISMNSKDLKAVRGW